MGISKLAKGGMAGVVLRWASRMRFPYLFALTAALFLLNVFLADPLPFADELLMGLVAILLGSLRKSRREDAPPPPADSAP